MEFQYIYPPLEGCSLTLPNGHEIHLGEHKIYFSIEDAENQNFQMVVKHDYSTALLKRLDERKETELHFLNYMQERFGIHGVTIGLEWGDDDCQTLDSANFYIVPMEGTTMHQLMDMVVKRGVLLP
jgi:hypothetical protein